MNDTELSIGPDVARPGDCTAGSTTDGRHERRFITKTTLRGDEYRYGLCVACGENVLWRPEEVNNG